MSINPQRVLDKILEEKSKLQAELRAIPKGSGRKELILQRIRIRDLLDFIEKLLGG